MNMKVENPVKVTTHDLVNKVVTVHYIKDYIYEPVLRNPYK